MKKFDFLKKAEEKAQALHKKAQDITAQIEKDPLSAFSQMVKPSKKEAKPSSKPDRSIEGISKQILAQRDSMHRNGFKEYEFITNRDCCATCAALNGKHFPVFDLEIGVNAPPMHEGCRCAICSYVDRAEYEAWLNHIANGGTTAQWKKAKKNKK